ncbi:MAG: radical SAM protein [Clostridia bacterium]|nr:radical SAM protein [Clostridia bacterium]MDD4571205.1 radical SAM protein [Clostridia bacterium]
MRCTVCENSCELLEGKKGKCGLYYETDGEILEKFPEQYLMICPISIETMPTLHFQPGAKFLQISTAGCNFDCPGCISTVIVKEMDARSNILNKCSAEQIIAKALAENCKGIAFLMNDPLASFFSFTKVAKLAKKHGLLVGCSTNAYFTNKSLNSILPYLDFVNIGLKGCKDDVYRFCGANSAKPVFRNIRTLFENGVHVEVSCIHNSKNKDEVLEVANILSDISPTIPLQIMRYIPLEGADPKLEVSIRESESLFPSLKEKLSYVYLFNSPGTDLLNTYCPKCGKLLVRRDFYGPMGAKLKDIDKDSIVNNTCMFCGKKLNFKNKKAGSLTNFWEGDFEGGYPFTRALDMIEAILITIGVKDKQTVVKVWEDILKNHKLSQLHHDIQKPKTYIEIVRGFGELANASAKAEELINYIEERLNCIKKGLEKVQHSPRVYYAMGKPLFCMKAGRMENQLVLTAGGNSVNGELEIEGRPGGKISVEVFKKLNPEIIFISSFISSTVKDFKWECEKENLNVDAVKNNKIYEHLAPGWDFGSPRWILGLMYIANILHPNVFNFDLNKEADMFYQKFYEQDFNLKEVNRSFSKPSCNWQWCD